MSGPAAGRGGVGIRLYVEGGETVRRAFDQVADGGKKMWAEIALGQRSANPAIRALSVGAAEARAAVDGLAGRAGTAGVALGSFGTAGLAAAVALGGLAAGMAKAREAMAFADEIDDSANSLAIGTTALQQYRYAMMAVGGSAEDADEAIRSFTAKLGEAQAGGRALKWFERLGFSREQLATYETAEDALGDVIERLAGLNKETERAAVSSKIGLGSMLALTREGQAGVEALMQAALDLGYVMDEQLIKQGADANQRFEEMSTIIDVQLKSAFVSLAPIILELGGFLTDLARTIADVADSWRDLDQRSTRGLRRQDDRLAQAQLDLLKGVSGPDELRGYQRMRWDGINIQRARIAVQLRDRSTSDDAPDRAGSLDDTAGSDRPRRTTPSNGTDAAARRQEREEEQREDRLGRVIEQREDLNRRIVQATNDEFRSISERAGIEVSNLAHAADQRRRAIERAVIEFDRTEGLRGLSRIEADELLAKEAELAAIEASRVDWRERRDLAARRLNLEGEAADHAVALLEIDGALATNAEERHRIEREILLLTQEIERKRRKEALDADPNLNDRERDQAMQRLKALQARQAGLFEQQEQNRLRSEFQSYGREVVQAIHEGRIGEYIGERIKEKLLDGALQALFSSFAPSGKGGGWLGDGLNFLAGSLKGFANGGYVSGPGGPQDDRVLARLSNGEFVVNATATRQARPFLEDLNRGGWSWAMPDAAWAEDRASMAQFFAHLGSKSASASTLGPTPVVNLPPITINAQGADAAGLARVEQAIGELNASIEERAVEAIVDYQHRTHRSF